MLMLEVDRRATYTTNDTHKKKQSRYIHSILSSASEWQLAELLNAKQVS